MTQLARLRVLCGLPIATAHHNDLLKSVQNSEIVLN